MSQPYVGEIRMFAGNFAPVGWFFCDGSVLPIDQYPTLFNLIGTTYGGDGTSTFQLPDLRGRFPVHQGSGPGATFSIGQQGGSPSVTLFTMQIPRHTHTPQAAASATTANAANAFPAGWADVPYSAVDPTVALAPQQLSFAGGSQPHENRQPYLAVGFIISAFGVFPSQT
ncbi:phage tail protein [Leifsonia shinshuensis]|uniref:Microcystin-dependent protein n=1 Tax=Leifsonia shinshuensis TaxID=150026 RepID=A0A853CNZ1_9MICO|nr:tail fiber protein [Leifsonia shinshuensis]NYJ22377.1 microcystin-dependent protein [Leifsonia shinshuensis]